MKNKFLKTKLSALLLVLLSAGCVSIPDQIKPVENFKLERYLGQWYEIARMDHSFERGLTHVKAHYSMRDDGDVRVANRGYDPDEKVWQEVEGKAYFVDSPNQAFLKVSFFWPFYGSYIIFELDHEHYQYAMACGPNTSYLWILSRTPQMPEDVKQYLLAKAAAAGFDVDQLIFVDQSPF